MPFSNVPCVAVLALVMITLTSCASDPTAVRADGVAPVCTRSYPLGSNLPTTTCVSAEAAA